MAAQPDLEPVDVDETVTAFPLEEVRSVGKYQLVYELGSGGMASVYLARVEGPQGFTKAVALKRIHPHLTRRKETVAMFLDEARIASKIHHPNVCTVFDFGEAGGEYYLAMEYLVGRTFAGVMRAAFRNTEGLTSTARWHRVVAQIVADAAQGLHAAHELKEDDGRPMNLVHRDVTPHNLFVTFDGAVKLMDFGVAWATERVTQTSTGTLKGKFAYMSPEQIAKKPFDRRVDVWSLGICLWESLTGHRLFRRGSDLDTILAIEREERMAPSNLVSAVPKELDAICLKALSRDPDERYGTAREMGRDLFKWLASTGEPVGMLGVAEVLEELFAEERRTAEKRLQDLLASQPPPSISGVVPSPRGDDGAAPRPKLLQSSASKLLTGVVLAAVVVAILLAVSSEPEPARVAGNLSPQPASTAPRESSGATPAHNLHDVRAGVAIERTDPQASPSSLSPGEPPTPERPPATTDHAEPETPVRAPSGTTARRAAPARTPALAPSLDEEPPREPRRARRRRSSANEPTTGKALVVTVGGWGDIRLQGRSLGRSPLQIELPVGLHRLEIRDAAGTQHFVRVQITEGQTTRVRVQL